MYAAAVLLLGGGDVVLHRYVPQCNDRLGNNITTNTILRLTDVTARTSVRVLVPQLLLPVRYKVCIYTAACCCTRTPFAAAAAAAAGLLLLILSSYTCHPSYPSPSFQNLEHLPPIPSFLLLL